jgi:hypothetical protein
MPDRNERDGNSSDDGHQQHNSRHALLSRDGDQERRSDQGGAHAS